MTMRTCMSICIKRVWVYMYVCICICIPVGYECAWIYDQCICVHVCVFSTECTRVLVYICIRVWDAHAHGICMLMDIWMDGPKFASVGMCVREPLNVQIGMWSTSRKNPSIVSAAKGFQSSLLIVTFPVGSRPQPLPWGAVYFPERRNFWNAECLLLQTQTH